MALRKPDGHRPKQPFKAWESAPVAGYEPHRAPRAILTADDLILVPESKSVRAIRAVDGKVEPATARVWPRGPGNLAQSNGVLVSLSAEAIARVPE